MESLDIFVLAGGLGTRVRSVLGDVPKVLAPIRGRAYLSHLLEWLQRYGARRVVLGLGHRAAAVIDYVRLHPTAGLDLVTLVEPRPLGTAGAIRFARPELHSDPVLIMNGDSFAEVDLCAFLDRHNSGGARATLLCAEVDGAGRYGRVILDERGRIARFLEKDSSFAGRSLINAGVYLISARLLDEIAVGAAVSLERDIFERMPASSLATFAGAFDFIDIGTPESLALANSSWSVDSAESNSRAGGK